MHHWSDKDEVERRSAAHREAERSTLPRGPRRSQVLSARGLTHPTGVSAALLACLRLIGTLGFTGGLRLRGTVLDRESALRIERRDLNLLDEVFSAIGRRLDVYESQGRF